MVVVGIAEYHLIGEERRSAAGNVGRLAFVSAFCGCCPEVSSGPLGSGNNSPWSNVGRKLWEFVDVCKHSCRSE
jgi:hypothetical protein